MWERKGKMGMDRWSPGKLEGRTRRLLDEVGVRSWRPLGFSGFVFSEWPNLVGARWVDKSDFEILQSSGRNNRKGVKHAVANILFIRVWIFSYLSFI
jgi:hypothetical protein